MAQETPGKRDDKSQWDGAKPNTTGKYTPPKDGGKHSGGSGGDKGGKKK